MDFVTTPESLFMAPFSLLLADAGPGPLLLPVVGGAAVAGFFLSLAAVSAGIWFLNRTQPLAAASWAKRGLILAGVASILSSPVLGLFALLAASGAAGIVAMIGLIA